jgi:hypothetical protein
LVRVGERREISRLARREGERDEERNDERADEFTKSFTKTNEARAVPSSNAIDRASRARRAQPDATTKVASPSSMARAMLRTDALDRRAAEVPYHDPYRKSARRALLLGGVGVLLLVIAFARTCWHGRGPHDAAPEENVLPTYER